jgi:dTDP-4-amino-4,6-dideoxygalactose transaminase/nucleoside-diphosphate-sugar epimerase
MRKILVTGAGGYLGTVLVPALLAAGHTVAAVDTFIFGDLLAEHADHPGLHIHHGDVRRLDPDLVAGVDTVIALAAISNDPAGAVNPVWTTAVNETAVARLAELARAAGARRLIHASSCGVYGHSEALIDEAAPLVPLSQYAQSKAAAEQTLTAVETLEFRVISLRLGTLFGCSPRMRFDLGVHTMTRRAVAEQRVTVDGDGQQWRPLLHVADAAAAFLACLDVPDERLPRPAVFNVVGENLRVADLAAQVAEGCDGAAIETTGASPDARSYRVSGARFAALTGFAPVRTVADGIAEVREYLAVPGHLDDAGTERFSTAATVARMLRTPAIKGGDPVRREPLPFALPLLGDAEETEVLETLRSGWLTTGPRVKRFEQMCADYLGVDHAVATNSCTGALHLALAAAGIRPGDEVITTPVTWPATANVIHHVGATTVFADIDPDTLNIDPAAVAAAVTEHTKAIMPVHMAGQAADLETIGAIAAEHGLIVIEDAAHAFGGDYHGRMIGQTSTMAAFSFYPTKNFTTIEGGVLATDDDTLADRARILCLHGISKDAWKRYSTSGSPHWELVEPGFKYNMPDICAAVGLHQLPRLEEFIATRARYADLYDALLADVPGIRIPVRRPGLGHTHHLYIIQLELDQLTISRDRFIEALRAEGIGTGVHFISLHLQPYHQRVRGVDPDAYPAARDASARIISLPLYPKMTDTDVHDVAAAVTKLATAYHR